MKRLLLLLIPFASFGQVKISDMTAAGTLTGTEIFPVVQSALNRKATINQVWSAMPFATTSISGQLNTTDWNTFNGKQDSGLSWLLGGSYSLTSANIITTTGTNNITINQTALGAGNGLVINSSSIDAASNTQTALRVNQTGANATSTQTTYSGFFSNTKTGTTNTNVGLYAEATGATTNWAIQAAGRLEINQSNTGLGGAFIVNPSTGGGAFSGIQFQNSTNTAQILHNSTTNSAFGGTNSLNLVNNFSAGLITFAPNAEVRYSISRFNHVWTQQGSSVGSGNFLSFTHNAQTGGSITGLLYTGGAHTGLTASDQQDINFNLNRNVTFTGSTGFATQRAYLIQAPTYNFTSPTGTITTAATLAVSGAPSAGANAAITNPYALLVQSGNLGLGGGATASQLRWLEASGGGSSYISFEAPALAANNTYVLPTAYPTISGQVLASTDAGVMSWANPSGVGDMILADAQTSQGKKTFSVQGGIAGINVGANATDPTTTLAAGDMYYQTSVGVRIYDGATWSTLAGGSSYYAPNVLSATATDADFTAAVNSIRHIPDGVATVNRAITIPAGSDGDVIELYNNEDTLLWTLTGATVYLADRTTTVTTLLYNVPTLMRKINGLWIITN